MSKRFVSILLVIFSLLGVTYLARASAVGEWDIQGTLKVTVKIKGFKPATEKGEFVDHFIFHPGGSFEMIDLDGTWMQKKTKFTVTLDPADIEAFFEEAFADEGLNAVVEVTSISFNGTEQKDGTIKGKYSFKMDIFLLDDDLEGKVSVSGTFTGTRIAGAASAFESGPILEAGSLFTRIADEIRKATNWP